MIQRVNHRWPMRAGNDVSWDQTGECLVGITHMDSPGAWGHQWTWIHMGVDWCFIHQFSSESSISRYEYLGQSRLRPFWSWSTPRRNYKHLEVEGKGQCQEGRCAYWCWCSDLNNFFLTWSWWCIFCIPWRKFQWRVFVWYAIVVITCYYGGCTNESVERAGNEPYGVLV